LLEKIDKTLLAVTWRITESKRHDIVLEILILSCIYSLA